MKRLFSPTLPSTSSFLAAPQADLSPTEEKLSPELVPIVALLSAQSRRRYHEGVFMLLNDLTSDGKPGERKWEEAYGVLIGTQLAVWDAEKLSKYRDNPQKLISTSSKPTYINFTDSSFKSVDKLSAVNGELNNVIIVSTTLKNRYLLQYSSRDTFLKWSAAFRLATFEYTSLQEAYTGALLSARGSRLSDIRVILAETKYEHADWVSVRFGSGMPWKRCYAVIEPSPKKSKKKFYPGKLVFYENEKKAKKLAMASVLSATSCFAVYPQSEKLVDQSTLIKLEGLISFSKKEEKSASVFLMPEAHYSVPGFDTLIRFLIPILDAFGLYGRPKKLNANKADPESLLFGLPVLPLVYYLEVGDILGIVSQPITSEWTSQDWSSAIKTILQRKLSSGYLGCGNVKNIESEDSLVSSEFNELTKSITSRSGSPSVLPTPNYSQNSKFNTSSKSSLKNEASDPDLVSSPESAERTANVIRYSNRLSEIYNKYSQLDSPTDNLAASTNQLKVNDRGNSRQRANILDDDDDDDDELPQKKSESNIFDPAYGDIDDYDGNFSDEEDLKQPKVQTPKVMINGTTPTQESFGRPGTLADVTQRNLSPYSEFHEQLTKSVGVKAYQASSKPLPSPPPSQNLHGILTDPDVHADTTTSRNNAQYQDQPKFGQPLSNKTERANPSNIVNQETVYNGSYRQGPIALQEPPASMRAPPAGTAYPHQPQPQQQQPMVSPPNKYSNPYNSANQPRLQRKPPPQMGYPPHQQPQYRQAHPQAPPYHQQQGVPPPHVRQVYPNPYMTSPPSSQQALPQQYQQQQMNYPPPQAYAQNGSPQDASFARGYPQYPQYPQPKPQSPVHVAQGHEFQKQTRKPPPANFQARAQIQPKFKTNPYASNSDD
ncbi:hypothetical protein PACTADRAFT_31414 [Pachysolen tannophilus NRRL Y-2460]|uniref:PH domain-containing protein n=1 Tax=Pachysolen tannophilus NRRL Y-2460 TaxID=669874 RepID=A0A1E4U1X4_PACTA|nr:hypothetical protein PACTADRAFT_31414 [Pachysolen tannophilus NRRL Y-2460]